MSAPNRFGSNRTKAIIAMTIDEDGNPLGNASNPGAQELIVGGQPVSATNPIPTTPVAASGAQVTTGTGYSSTATATRPNNTTPYVALQVIGPAVTGNWVFAAIGPAGGRVVIDYVSLELDVAAVPAGMGNFRLHIYSAAPTALADGAAYNLIAADRDKHIGYIDLPVPDDLGDTLWSQNLFERLPCKLAAASTTLYGVLKTLQGYTPTASVVKVIKLHAFQEAAA